VYHNWLEPYYGLMVKGLRYTCLAWAWQEWSYPRIC